MAATPKASWPWVRALRHSVYDQPDAASVHPQFDRVLDALADKLPPAAEHLEAARADVLAFTAFPKEVWRQISELQPQRAAQPRDPPAHRRRRHLPRPRRPEPTALSAYPIRKITRRPSHTTPADLTRCEPPRRVRRLRVLRPRPSAGRGVDRRRPARTRPV